MKKYRKWIQYSVLSVALIIGIYAVFSTLYKPDNSVKIGSLAPEFSLATLDKQVLQLSDFEGKSLIINFWGTFCPPCVNEMPALQKQYNQWKEDNVVVLGINLSESTITVKNFINQYDITFPIVIDNNDQIRKRYNVRYYPTTFFVDSSSIIQEIFIGEMKEEDIINGINKLIQ